jgi:hypothetical protein
LIQKKYIFAGEDCINIKNKYTMKKNLLAIGLLAFSFSVQAQNVLLNVDANASFYVSEGALVYNGGGLQTKGNGMVDLHGNMMVVGTGADALRTVTAANAAKTDGGNIVIRLNTVGAPATSTYGQLYIDGIAQGNLTGIVSKEYKTARQGNGNYYQQIAMPFSGKVLGSLSSELGKGFSQTRYSRNEILKWNNALVVSDHVTNLANTTSDPTGYYMLGSNNNNLTLDTPPAALPTIAPTVTGTVFTLNGTPYTQTAAAATLQNAGNGISFGSGGNAVNQYNEKYNTYLQDQFETSGTPWSGTYGKNIYQFGNPFFTNIDLTRIGYAETAATGDGNNITNIWGVRYDPGVVSTLSNGSTYSTGAKIITYDTTTRIPLGDINLGVLKPMQTFVLKLRDNTNQTLNFNTLRRFNSTARADGTNYSVTAAKTTGNGTIKQLGVIALDAAGNEIGRTYYVVSPAMTTGHQTTLATSVQATSTPANAIGTFEEDPAGGYDTNYLSSYWLYINEANEVNFQGKNIKLVNYDYGVANNAVNYKFEIFENGEAVPAGTHQLSSGIGFYYKAENGSLVAAANGATLPISSAVSDLYYGQPANVLATANAVKPSRTVVVYNPAITNYIVRFDPAWKKADIQVFDMSGKLIITKAGVSTSKDFVIELDGSLRNSYVVKIVADNGETVNAKILK